MSGENGAKKLKFAAIGAAVTGVAAAGLITLELPAWVVEMTRLWGPGFLMIGLVFAGIAYYIPRGVVKDFVVAQQGQAVALSGIKDQMTVIAGQAGQLGEIKETLSEILTNQHVAGDRLKTIESRLYEQRRENDT